MKAAARGNNAFALSLYRRIAKDEGNLFFSPFSLSTALAMTYAGARGETAQQMSKALHFALPPDRLHPAFQGLIEGLASRPGDEAVVLLIANSLWGQQDFAFRANFVDLVENRYSAALRQVDFFADTERARVLINGWTDRRTAGKISQLIPSGALDPRSRLVVVNAVYFLGKWKSPFLSEDTREGLFSNAAGRRVPAKFMQQTDRFPYFQNEGLQALQLPYENERISMIVLLPARSDGLADLEEGLTLSFLDDLRRELKPRQVRVLFPKIRLQGRFSLAKVLSGMGMPQAFSARQADFSGMTGRKELSIRAVVHQAVLEVDEQGTEAAGATGIVIGVTSAPAQPAALFKADHPFFFIVTDQSSGAILFAGRLSELQN